MSARFKYILRLSKIVSSILRSLENINNMIDYIVLEELMLM